jgi:ATP-dependent Clp protease adaptor protein ClpS
MSKDLVKSRKNKILSKVNYPKFYHVIILNDNFTTMEFVVKVLIMFFNLSLHQATIIMLKIHNNGLAIVGTYTKDIAETLVSKVNNYSKQNSFPLKSIIKAK